MRLPAKSILTASLLALSAATTSAGAQQDGLIAYPDVYKVQFENPYVRLIRVRLPGNARLGDHTHPPGIMLHVYFTDADPVQFNHDGPPNDVTRPSVVACSYRVGRATPETHTVNNMGPRLSDYMRVELKTQGDEGQRARIATPPLYNTNSAQVEVTNAQYKSTRVTVAVGQSMDLAATATEPFLLLALTDGSSAQSAGKDARSLKTGDEYFVEQSSSVSIRNASSTPVQLLRIDFLTKPLK